MSNRKRIKVVVVAVIASIIGITLLLGAKSATAHGPTATFGSPYYGAPGDGVWRRWLAGGVHYGIDFLLRWTSVLAAADGSVEFASWFNSGCHDEDQPGCADISQSGFGLYVRINHGPADHPYRTIYGHLSVARTAMGTVRKGEWIGTSGDSGYSSTPHLHFEVRHNGLAQTNAVNPDNEGGVSLWNDGEWSGTIPATPVPAWRFPTLSAYGGETVIDDTPDNTGGFTKGRSGTIACPPDAKALTENNLTIL
jgi:murein DD-endopeptidase MepM/ murein hydrolase activator NlpD